MLLLNHGIATHMFSPNSSIIVCLSYLDMYRLAVASLPCLWELADAADH